jgi:hypothetical protein
VLGTWRKLQNEEQHNFYSSSRQIRIIMSRRMRWARNVAQMERRECIWVIGGKPEGKRSLRKTRYKYNNNIEIDLEERVDLFRLRIGSREGLL